MAHEVDYRPATGEIPTDPGVYRFYGEADRILYVGKAKNLRARLSNYFGPLESLHERTRRMVTSASRVEWTVVGSEFEALQLEFTWIKQFNPPFNVQFRDDKSYPYLAVTVADDVPRVFITRSRNHRGARYFGPYTNVRALRDTLDLLLKVFPMRSCSPAVYRRAELSGRPCLLADIGKCSAPCVGRISKEDHRAITRDLVAFMSGADKRMVRQLRARMAQAAQQQDYEAAARYRDQVRALETVLAKSAVVLAEDVDADVFGIDGDELAAAVQQFIVRGGRIRGVRSWVVDIEVDVTRASLIETVLRNAYSDDEFAPPAQVLVPQRPDDDESLAAWLTQRRRQDRPRSGAVTLHVPQRGDKVQLVRTAERNAAQSLVLYKTRRSGDFATRSQALTDIQSALGMTEAPLRMECFDVSHLGGTNVVASMVVFEDGLPRKDLYRRFSIAETSDDTDSIRQVLTRRLAHLDDPVEPERRSAPDGGEPAPVQKFAYRPQLLIVDGGKPQVSAAAEALTDAGIEGIALCGLAKRLEEIWLPDDDYPVILPRRSDALFLLQRIRDEAHRFAITYQRARRTRTVNTALAEVPGLGPTKARALLRVFGSVKKIREASADELQQVSGVGPRLAEAILTHLESR